MPNQLANALPAVHAASTWFMCGVIWFVQIVHYPLMGIVRSEAFSAYAQAHQRRTTWIVAPAMIVEAATASLLAWVRRDDVESATLTLVGLALLAIVWANTWAIMVPLHAKLAQGFDESSWRRLVFLNWPRSIAWTGRAIIAAVLLN